MDLHREVLPADSKVVHVGKVLLVAVFVAYVLNLIIAGVFGMFWMVGMSNGAVLLSLFGIIVLSVSTAHLLVKKLLVPSVARRSSNQLYWLLLFIIVTALFYFVTN